MDEPNSISGDDVPTGNVRARILEVASELIASGGRDAATTRAVAAAAGVQAPTIYRLFGDKQGLLDAVVEYGLTVYVAEKGMLEPHPDPVQDLRDGWDMHVAFGLAHPGLFAIMSGNMHARPLSPAMVAGQNVLRRRIRNIALAGRLRISEARALALLQSVGTGTILTLLSEPRSRRDEGLSEKAREIVIGAIIGEVADPIKPGPSGPAAALQASLEQTTVLTQGERYLLAELLNRIANDG